MYHRLIDWFTPFTAFIRITVAMALPIGRDAREFSENFTRRSVTAASVLGMDANFQIREPRNGKVRDGDSVPSREYSCFRCGTNGWRF